MQRISFDKMATEQLHVSAIILRINSISRLHYYNDITLHRTILTGDDHVVHDCHYLMGANYDMANLSTHLQMKLYTECL